MKFEFNVSVSSYFWMSLKNTLLTIITLGLYYTWAICAYQRWKAENITLDGKKLQFVGTGGKLFFHLLKMNLLTFITCGIYRYWAVPKTEKWFVEHTNILD